MAKITIEVADEKLLKVLEEYLKSSNAHIVTSEEPNRSVETEKLKENSSLSDVNKVKTINKVETPEESINMEKLLSDCQKLLIEAVKAGKRDYVKNIFTKLGIVSLSTADGGQLIDFKGMMEHAE